MSRIALSLLCCLACRRSEDPPSEADSPDVDLASAAGQVLGAVVTYGTGEPVAGATVTASTWKRLGGTRVDFDHPPVDRVTDNEGAFAIDPYAGDEFDPASALEPGWTRFEIRAPGYDPAVFYRTLAFDEVCSSPFAGGSEVSCTHQAFDLIRIETTDVPLLPDMTVDEGWLADCRLDHRDPRRVHISVGTPNVGRGPADVRSVRGSGVVRQVVHNKNGSTAEREIDGAAFEFDHHEGHQHFHFENWTHLRLLDLDTEETLGMGHKVSFCLIDLEPYDLTIYDEVWGQDTRYGCGVSHGEIQQGLSPGWADVYDQYLPGQEIEVGPLDPGLYWLEVEVDPLGFIEESDETNNVKRQILEIPAVQPEGYYNPCQPGFTDWPDTGDTANSWDSDTDTDTGAAPGLDLTGRTEIVPLDTCADALAAASLMTVPEGSYYGDLSLMSDDDPIIPGQDAYLSVTVPANKTLFVDTFVENEDPIVSFALDCANPEYRDWFGTGDWETFSWRNDTGADTVVVVGIDTFDTVAAGTLFALDVALN